MKKIFGLQKNGKTFFNQSLLIKMFLNIAISFATSHQSYAQKSQPVIAKTVLENTLLWEISGGGLSRPSYLFGTMHLLCADDAKLSDSLNFAIQASLQTYFEIDLDNLSETLGAIRYIKMNDNKQLKDLLTPEEYERVKAYFEKNKTLLPFSMMQKMKPYFITAMISESGFDCPQKDGMEQVIMNEAKQQKKPILGLETAQLQASVFDSIPYEKQAKELLKMVDSAGTSSSKANEELLKVYRQQNLQQMLEMTEAEEGGINEYLDFLLYNRNANWAEKMPGIMKEKQTLFAVGAAHLPGDRGVINLLRKKGFTLRPMKHLPGMVSAHR